MKQVFHDMLEREDEKIYRFFDGKEWKLSASGKTVSVYSTIDGSVLGNIQSVTHEEIDRVITEAHKAQEEWEKKSLHERNTIVYAAARYMREEREELAAILTLEIGKTKQDALSEVDRSADLLEYFAREVQSLRGTIEYSDAFPGFDTSKFALINRSAHGVVLAIAPFNYPINLAVSKIIPALLMGNAVIFKPPTQGSIIGLYITRIFQRAGLPSYLLSCITGAGKDIGDYLVSHKQIQMIAFTGSSNVGKSIAGKTGMIPLLFECGGNNPVIILEDADMELTAKELVKGAFSYAGQRCTGIKYVLAREQVITTILPFVLKYINEMVHVGDPRSEYTALVGPLISEESAKEVEIIVHEAIEQGAELVHGGKRNGRYMDATVLKHVTSSMKCVAEEVFGPILSFVRIETISNAIEIINRSQYGLQASIFTKDEGTALAYAKMIRTGTVQVNGSPQRGPDHFPFMGTKDSGVGVQGVRYSLEAMSRITSIVLNNPQ
jgi:glyceraldehyde-3-phosphate dehydrogenase (NADP+)